MARRNTDELKKWLRKNKLTTQDSLKYLGLTITLNNTWTKHTEHILKKIRNKHDSLKLRGLQWKYLKPLTNINLIKKILIPIITYGAEIMTLNKTNKEQINKKIARIYKDTLDLDSFTPTDWILWEIDQQKIETIILERKLNYWSKILTQPNDTIQQKILKYNKSLFTTTIIEETNKITVTSTEESENKEQIINGIQNPKNLPKKYTWKTMTKQMIETNRNNETWLKQTTPNQHRYYDIKQHNGIDTDLFNVNQNEMALLNTTLHLRAQTINIPSDIHPKTYNKLCKLCNKKTCDLEHLTFECEETKEERTYLNEALSHLLEKDITKLNSKNDKDKINSILSLSLTNDKSLNITILKAYCLFIETIEYPKPEKKN